MKVFLKKILKYYLKYITKLVLFIHRPTIIVVAGSTNKQFVRDEIKKILKNKGKHVRANPKNYNTEIGLPLAVLGLKSGYNSYKNWLPAIFEAPKKIFEKNFPEYFVLMLGTSDPGDIKYLLTIIKPKIAIITDISQRYLEGFSDLNELVGEYGYLVKKLPEDGLLLFNNDNSRIKDLKGGKGLRTISFGLEEGSNFRALKIEKYNYGQKVEVKLDDNRIKTYNTNRFGLHHIYSLLIGLIINKYVK